MRNAHRPTGRAAALALILFLLSGCGEGADPATAHGPGGGGQGGDAPGGDALGGYGPTNDHPAEGAGPTTTPGEDRPPDVLARLLSTVPPNSTPTTATVAQSTTPSTEAPSVTGAAQVTEAPPPPGADAEKAQPEPTEDQQPPPTTDPLSKVGYFIEMTNQLRAGLGLTPLQVSGPLAHSAGQQAEHMAATNSLAHQDLQDELSQGWTLVGENVGYGPSAESVFQALVNSPGHYANMTSSGFTHAGMATRWDNAGRLWVAQVFGG